MKLYLMSLGAGLLVGIIYALIDVRSPAPPIVALVGLFGILVGEQIPPLIKGYLRQTSAAHTWLHQVQPHMFGHLPRGSTRLDTISAGLEHDDAPSQEHASKQAPDSHHRSRSDPAPRRVHDARPFKPYGSAALSGTASSWRLATTRT